jgi:hypothetical protein
MAAKFKIPKRLAGVKIPKGIRKGPIGDFVKSSGGQVVLAEALLALGTYLAARRVDPDGATEILRHPIDSIRSGLAGESARYRDLTSTRLARAFEVGLQAFRAELHGTASNVGVGLQPDLGIDEVGAEGALEREPAKKKSSSRGQTPREAPSH